MDAPTTETTPEVTPEVTPETTSGITPEVTTSETKKPGNKSVTIAIVAIIIAALIGVAIFLMHPYKINYELDGGSLAEGSPESYTILSGAELVAPERDGYVFAGWTGDGLTSAQKEVSIPAGTMGERTYTATWHELVAMKVDKVTIKHGDITANDESNTVKLALWGKNDGEWEPITTAQYAPDSKNVKMSFDKKNNVTTYTLKKSQATFENVEDVYKSYMVLAESAASYYDVDKADGLSIAKDKVAEFTLTFNPDTWKLNLKVKVADKNLEKIIDKVGIRVLCWNAWDKEQAYKPINQHKKAYLTVRPSVNGTDQHVVVWKWDKESTHSYPKNAQTDPQTYYFSADVVGYKLADGKVLAVDDKKVGLKAKITVKDGATAGDREAVYLKHGKDGDKQQGTLTIELTAKEFDVSLHPNGGKIESGNVHKYTFGTGTALPSKDQMTRKGYDFAGWFKNDGTNTEDWGKEVTKIDEYTSGDQTLYAKWEDKVLTVHFNTGDGSAVQDQKVKYGKTAERPADPKLKNYEFEGWCIDKQCTKAFSFNTEITEDTTLYAKWSEAKKPADK